MTTEFWSPVCWTFHHSLIEIQLLDLQKKSKQKTSISSGGVGGGRILITGELTLIYDCLTLAGATDISELQLD